MDKQQINTILDELTMLYDQWGIVIGRDNKGLVLLDQDTNKVVTGIKFDKYRGTYVTEQWSEQL